MKIQTLVVGQMQTNCYLISCSKTQETLIIDPGDDPDFIYQKIRAEDLIPRMILATHGHFDHILAVSELKSVFQIPFGIHSADKFLLKNMTQSANYWLKNTIPYLPPQNEIDLKEGQIINFGQETITVITLPGHTPGSVGFYSPQNNILFSGDTLFADGVGRTDFKYSCTEDLKKSVKRIKSLPEKTVVYCGHGRQLSRTTG